MDSTSIMTAVNDILKEWIDLGRKGKIILHCDGQTLRKVEYDYYIDLKG